jgi:WD40 repeat protein
MRKPFVVLLARIVITVGAILGQFPGQASATGETVEQTPPAAPAEQAELVLDAQGFSSAVRGLAFSPDGRLLAAAGSKEVRIWDVTSGQAIATLRGQRERNAYGNCYAVAFSPDGRNLVVGIDDYSSSGSIRVYDTKDFGQIRKLLPGHYAPVKHLAFSRDGKYLASAGENGKILFWRWADQRFAGSVMPSRPDQPVYSYFEFPTAASYLCVQETQGISVLSVPGGTRLTGQGWYPREIQDWLTALPNMRLPLTSSSTTAMTARLEQGAWLIGGMGKDNGRDAYCVGFWKGNPRTPTVTYQSHRYLITTVALTPDASLAASADALGDIHVWDTRTAMRRHLFRGVGQPVYRVAFDESGRILGLGTTPVPVGPWARNNYGKVEQAWYLDTRKLTFPPQSPYRRETPALEGRSLAVTQPEGMYHLIARTQDGQESRTKVRPGVTPTCYTLLRASLLGLKAPAVIGDDTGAILGYEAGTWRVRRDFVGHQSFVTSLSESPDGRLLASSSTDGTIRLWSLLPSRPHGDVDFEYLSDTVTEVKPGTSAAQAGIRVGDRFVSLDGHSLTELENMALQGRFPYGPGQRVTIKMERDSRPYQAEVVLRTGNDVVQPLLSIFLTTNNEWVMWTPQGYYDASPGGDRLIGWHINQGPARSAKFYSVHQFRKRLYRPDIVDLVLKLGDVDEAVRVANASLPRAEDPVDLREPEVILRLEPPLVRILEPAEGARVRSAQIPLRVDVESQNELPISEVTILVNGRPQATKGVRVEPTGTGQRRTIVENLTLVPGVNQISVIAANAASSSQPVTVNVSYESQEPSVPLPDLYILSIGISRYAREDLNLSFAHKDAKAFADAWTGQQGAVYRNVQTKTLLDEEANGRNIRAGMDWLVKSVSQRDLAVVFISAHGLRDERQEYYLASHEIDPTSLRSTGIHFREVKALLRDLPCKVLLFADTCHSGGITGAKLINWDDPLRDLVSEEYGAVVFSSSLPREVSLEDPAWQHGAFTKALLDTLGSSDSDYDRNGYLSISELEVYLDQGVKQLTKGRQHPVVERPPTIPNFNFFKLAEGRAGTSS